jgi:pimeloyl-ACP methyl ester carboxylesterase
VKKRTALLVAALTTAVAAGTAAAVAVIPVADASVTHGITWGACPATADGIPADPRRTCGTVTVPLDHRRPHDRTITIAVSRIAAADPAKRHGVLLLNPGGPGLEGLNEPSEFAARASADVRDRYDLIGFDPRGVGHSAPVTCGLSAAEMVPASPFPAPDGSIDANVAFARSAAARCAQRSGAVLPYITTANTARDIDSIRQALGERTVSYYGGSYGTYLGAVYRELFPGRVDRMVLDSAVDPALVWYEQLRTQDGGMTVRFPDAARVAVANAATIGFGSTVDEVTARWTALAARLDQRPVTVPGAVVPLNGNVFRQYTYALLFQDSVLEPLAQAWRATADLADGKAAPDGITLLQAVMRVVTPSSTTSPDVPADNSIAAAYAITCGDTRYPGDVREYARNVAADRRADPLSAGFAANVWPCAFWPYAPREQPVRITSHGSRNVLIVQNDRDPATPVEPARGMRRALGHRSVLVTVDAGGHGLYGLQGPGACATVAVDTFLAGGMLPATDTHCPKP